MWNSINKHKFLDFRDDGIYNLNDTLVFDFEKDDLFAKDIEFLDKLNQDSREVFFKQYKDEEVSEESVPFIAFFLILTFVSTTALIILNMANSHFLQKLHYFVYNVDYKPLIEVLKWMRELL